MQEAVSFQATGIDLPDLPGASLLTIPQSGVEPKETRTSRTRWKPLNHIRIEKTASAASLCRSSDVLVTWWQSFSGQRHGEFSRSAVHCKASDRLHCSNFLARSRWRRLPNWLRSKLTSAEGLLAQRCHFTFVLRSISHVCWYKILFAIHWACQACQGWV